MEKEKYNVLGTKVSPEMAEVLNKICDVMHVDVYHLLQWFVYTVVRASSPQHETSPEIQKLMTLMETDAGWQNAFNLCNPDGLRIAQCILVLEQEGHKGFGAVMIDKPFMGETAQTECVDDILERVISVTMPGINRRLHNMAKLMQCEHLSDLLLSMIDAQMIIELDKQDKEEMQGPSDYSDRGKRYAYGKKTKSKHHRTPDSVANQQQHIRFDDQDRELANDEAFSGEYRQNDEAFGGEYRQNDEPPKTNPFADE